MVEESACANALNNLSWSSAAMPDAGVDDVEVEGHPLRVLVEDLDPDDHLALGGELDGVRAEVEQDLADPGRVPEQRRGHVGMHVDQELDSLAVGRAGQDAPHVVDHAGHVELGLLDVHLPRLDLREVQDVVDDHQQALGRHLDAGGKLGLLVARGSVWSRSSVSPITPFIGVRISWLIVETNCDLVREATKAASRAATRSSAA